LGANQPTQHMNIAVCIKQVPDVAAPLQVRDGSLVLSTDRMLLNAYDASAVEAALVLREHAGGEIAVILAGTMSAQESIRKALAMGADRAVHLVLPDHEATDSAACANMLTNYFRQQSFDLLLFGKQSQDTDAGLAGGMVAAALELPFATNAVGIEIEGDQIVVRRQGDSGTEVLELPMPCLVTCSNDMNDPRTPNVKGIMQARKKPLETETPDPAPSLTQIQRYEALPSRPPATMLTGTAEEQARQLVEKIL
jgi:electron transfer flavoprotein beta subunit